MKRLVPVAIAALLALATARVPAATAASPSLTSQQNEELVESYARLTLDFYKKVDRQAALDGARVAIVDYLKKHHVTNPVLPSLRASESDDAGNAEALSREVASAVGSYASKLEPVESISPSNQITYAAIAGVLASVKDRYTTFLSPKEYAALTKASTARRSAASASRICPTTRRRRCTSRASSSTARPTRPACSPKTRSPRSTRSRSRNCSRRR